MTGKQLRKLREDRKDTRRKLSSTLNCSESAIVKWERDENTIPQWVAEKMIRGMRLTLPINDLARIIDYARREGVTADEYLSTLIVNDNRLTEDHKALRVAEEHVEYNHKTKKP